ncbi:MAG TPA: ABC transporter ATP-binding protein [Candidatus Dormibacteraeota bacterium]|nr:ABC transporter ATP-binding protein [Candidatus Dormibacteraeota bacterium]
MSALLTVDGLRKHFGGTAAVDGATFQVEAGAITGLIGPNGAGKSTVVDLVSGLLRPDSGVVHFDEKSIQSLPMHMVSRLGLLRSFQVSREWPRFTLMENMLAAAIDQSRAAMWRAVFRPGPLRKAQERDAVRARALLEEFGLLAMRDDRASTLSGGQKRLLEFARLLMPAPRMVLLDEPLAGVHPVMIDRVRDAVLRMKARGVTVLMIEHNLAMVEECCDNVYVMAFGRMVASGSMRELRANELVKEAYLGSDD